MKDRGKYKEIPASSIVGYDDGKDGATNFKYCNSKFRRRQIGRKSNGNVYDEYTWKNRTGKDVMIRVHRSMGDEIYSEIRQRRFLIQDQDHVPLNMRYPEIYGIPPRTPPLQKPMPLIPFFPRINTPSNTPTGQYSVQPQNYRNNVQEPPPLTRNNQLTHHPNFVIKGVNASIISGVFTAFVQVPNGIVDTRVQRVILFDQSGTEARAVSFLKVRHSPSEFSVAFKIMNPSILKGRIGIAVDMEYLRTGSQIGETVLVSKDGVGFLSRTGPPQIPKNRFSPPPRQMTKYPLPNVTGGNRTEILFVYKNKGPLRGNHHDVFFTVSSVHTYERFLRTDLQFRCVFGGSEAPQGSIRVLRVRHLRDYYNKNNLAIDQPDDYNLAMTKSSCFVISLFSPAYHTPGFVDVEIRYRNLSIRKSLCFQYVDDGANEKKTGSSVNGLFEDEEEEEEIEGENTENLFYSKNYYAGPEIIEGEYDSGIFGASLICDAIAQGIDETVEYYVGLKGFDATREDLFGITPIMVAEYFNNEVAMEMLRSAESETKKEVIDENVSVSEGEIPKKKTGRFFEMLVEKVNDQTCGEFVAGQLDSYNFQSFGKAILVTLESLKWKNMSKDDFGERVLVYIVKRSKKSPGKGVEKPKGLFVMFEKLGECEVECPISFEELVFSSFIFDDTDGKYLISYEDIFSFECRDRSDYLNAMYQITLVLQPDSGLMPLSIRKSESWKKLQIGKCGAENTSKSAGGGLMNDVGYVSLELLCRFMLNESLECYLNWTLPREFLKALRKVFFPPGESSLKEEGSIFKIPNDEDFAKRFEEELGRFNNERNLCVEKICYQVHCLLKQSPSDQMESALVMMKEYDLVQYETEMLGVECNRGMKERFENDANRWRAVQDHLLSIPPLKYLGDLFQDVRTFKCKKNVYLMEDGSIIFGVFVQSIGLIFEGEKVRMGNWIRPKDVKKCLICLDMDCPLFLTVQNFRNYINSLAEVIVAYNLAPSNQMSNADFVADILRISLADTTPKVFDEVFNEMGKKKVVGLEEMFLMCGHSMPSVPLKQIGDHKSLLKVHNEMDFDYEYTHPNLFKLLQGLERAMYVNELSDLFYQNVDSGVASRKAEDVYQVFDEGPMNCLYDIDRVESVDLLDLVGKLRCRLQSRVM